MDASNKVESRSDLPVDVIESVQTAATGTNYTALPTVAGVRMVRFVHPTAAIQVREVGGTKTVTFPADAESVIYTAQNSNQLEVRRADTSNTQLTIALLIGKYPTA